MPDPLLSLLVSALLGGIGLLIFWPDRGLYWRWQFARQTTERVLMEDTLKHIHESEMQGRRPTVQSIAGALSVTVDRVAELLPQMEARELLVAGGDGYRLSPKGRDYALQIVRAHRLWERYLAEETGFAQDEWHTRAHRREHLLTAEEVDALATRLGHPTHDPHGDPIPTADGKLVLHDGHPMTQLAVDQPARIVHLEDEPANVYAQLVAEELYPGMQIRVTEVTPQRVRFWADGDEHILAPILAANVMVVPSPQERLEAVPTRRLNDLKPGEKAKVASISHAVRGNERRRFMDLGILPGTEIEADLKSPSGDPTAYRVRGTLIALRHDQADGIYITDHEESLL
jgi:DtxR family Mn-dependent transcriptional regulator